MKKRRRRNIAAGYYDEDGVFRPIRASYDYDPKRVGERRRRRSKSPRKRRGLRNPELSIMRKAMKDAWRKIRSRRRR